MAAAGVVYSRTVLRREKSHAGNCFRRTRRIFKWCGPHSRQRTGPSLMKQRRWKSFLKWKGWNMVTGYAERSCVPRDLSLVHSFLTRHRICCGVGSTPSRTTTHVSPLGLRRVLNVSCTFSHAADSDQAVYFRTTFAGEHVMLIFSMMWKVSPNHADVFFSQAWNKRLGTSGLGPAEILQYSKEHNIDPSTIPTIVEVVVIGPCFPGRVLTSGKPHFQEDSWLYNTTRFGEQTMGGSAVCCVFGCHIWKAGGLFDGLDDIQCTEQTNFDDYSLTMFDTTTPRPEACQQADPNNVVCQLEGKYTLHLNSYDTRKAYRYFSLCTLAAKKDSPLTLRPQSYGRKMPKYGSKLFTSF